VITFDDILGQERAVSTLKRALEADRLPHGLIFAGPTGVGKATSARALATVFLCEHASGSNPCGKCDACLAMETESHPDYHVLRKELIRNYDKSGKSKATEFSVHVIRPELIERAGRKPSMGRGNVFILEQSDLLNASAQNAMLKVLEEPPGRTIIILLTDQPGALLPTIRSRCQTIPFATLDADLVRKELERRKIDRQTAIDAADLSEGSLGLALKWIQDGVVAHARQLTAQLNSVVEGRVPETLEATFRKAADDYAIKQLERDELASKDQATRDGLTLYLKLAGVQFRKLLSGPMSDPVRLERLCAAIDAMARAEEYLAANVTISLVFQQLASALEVEFASR
jgi:DNA polymerase-3 subunit delta'